MPGKQATPYVGEFNDPTLKIGNLDHVLFFKPLRNWVDEFIPYGNND